MSLGLRSTAQAASHSVSGLPRCGQTVDMRAAAIRASGLGPSR
jgi:hypothetical protein